MLASTYGGSTIKNFVYGICAWHIIHRVHWRTEDNELQTLLTAGKRLAPNTSNKKEKEPWTMDYLTKICEGLNLEDPRDAATLACLTTAFWGTARLGEVTVPNLWSFDPCRHPKISNIEHDIPDPNGFMETVIRLPWTKSAWEKGEKIFWAQQDGVTDPKAALANHLKVNNPPDTHDLFSFKQDDNLRPMTRSIFNSRIKQITTSKKLHTIPGHGIRVGSTLEYLLRGLPFDVVKAKGRWQSEAFKGYLREHTQIMTPYMQANPSTYETFVRYAMPPVR